LKQNEIKVAILDLYNGEENQGIRCIKDILNEIDCKIDDVNLKYDLFDIRSKFEIPGTDYHIYISSGGPGSPWDGLNSTWEEKYFKLVDELFNHNKNSQDKKYIFFICHSFQLMCRFFKLGEVTKRHSKSFGIHHVNKTADGFLEPIFEGLPEQFYIADFREWQVIRPDMKVCEQLGAKILCLEKERPHTSFERALMAIRISDEIIGTQFHPEADPASMYYHFRKPDRKEFVINKYGEAKYREMLEHLQKPESILLTHNTVLPKFITNAINKINYD